MANNVIKYNSRITLKYDSLTNWNAVKNTFTPLKGEVCIVNPSENLGSGTTDVLIKVGDGQHTFAQLEYISAKAADVHAWAKLPLDKITELLDKGETTYNGTKYTTTSFATNKELEDAISALEGRLGGAEGAIDTLGESLTTRLTPSSTSGAASVTNKFISAIEYDKEKDEAKVYYKEVEFPTVDDSLKANSSNAIANKAVYTETQAIRELIGAIDSDITGLENKVKHTMHFIGVDKDNILTDGGNQVPDVEIEGGYTPAAGDVVISGGYEFVYTIENKWERLGQDSNFMLADHKITKDNVAANAAIEQTKIASTLGKANLAGDISDIDARLDAIEGKNNTQDSEIGILERDTWKTVTRNKVTQAAQGSFTSGLQNTETGASTLNASDLTIGTDVIGYIIWDCGSASTNV